MVDVANKNECQYDNHIIVQDRDSVVGFLLLIYDQKSNSNTNTASNVKNTLFKEGTIVVCEIGMGYYSKN